jgi:hypothetical protein
MGAGGHGGARAALLRHRLPFSDQIPASPPASPVRCTEGEEEGLRVSIRKKGGG